MMASVQITLKVSAMSAIYAGINATEEELEEALCIIQDFDPAGLGT